MYKLVSEVGRWAFKDNSMIFCNVIWLGSENDKHLYHLIDDNKNEIKVDKDKCLVKDEYYFD